ncbi:quinone oxidoreductase family protein [Paraburkholderia atlantica]|uniref:Alcohol dehydrogenase zinc-binding domain protein n=1 Tax=Paraburkholderia atlantica TaxID=2654982 RepID=D5WDP9_PARAM|nr:quinone oxidoreductase [Paraburkholderia atlantica]ADG18852.1 Alcohol dehydrogenase zinc-binding domain protein [Paraburkholderia atlantica]MBB5505095.1 NADPH2:quinone reductase [Paraburkholderia atlantica]
MSFSSASDTPSLQAVQIAIEQYGDASTLRLREATLPAPAAGEVRIRHTAIGVNFVDIYHRTGVYHLQALPAVLGVEAAGVIDAVGAGAESLHLGQRVAYAGPPVGSYASARNISADRVLPLPDDVADDTAASVLLRGITAHMLCSYVYRVKACDTVLVHAAAGGLGLVVTQWAKALGARVIGTVGSVSKAELAKEHGLDEAILYREHDLVTEIKALTKGQGVDYAIDGIGGKTLIETLGTVRPFGMVASIGQVSGDLEPIDLSLLGPARSIAISRPSVFRFMADPVRYREGALATFQQLRSGLRAKVGAVIPLAQAAVAHRRLETGETSGSILLRP